MAEWRAELREPEAGRDALEFGRALGLSQTRVPSARIF